MFKQHKQGSFNHLFNWNIFRTKSCEFYVEMAKMLDKSWPNESLYSEWYNLQKLTIEDPDQPVHQCSLERIFNGPSMIDWFIFCWINNENPDKTVNRLVCILSSHQCKDVLFPMLSINSNSSPVFLITHFCCYMYNPFHKNTSWTYELRHE